MAGQGSGRGGLGETMGEFLRARHRDLKHFGHDAEAAAREAYRRAIRDGEDLVLKTSGDVMRYGAGLLGAKKRPAQIRAAVPVPMRKVASAAPVHPPAAARTGSPPSPQWWDSNPVVRGVGAIDALALGIRAGVLRGGRHSAEGLVDGSVFLGRLINPWDKDLNKGVPTAREQLVDAGRGAADYVRKGIADPQRVVDDAKAKARQMRVDLDPTATPSEATLGAELRRNFNVGMNEGEFAFDVGSTLYGGPLAKSVREVGLLSKMATYEKSIAQGMHPKLAEYLSEPYDGIGHHAALAQRFKLPAVLGGGALPPKIMNSEFNVLSPPGITRGEMLERHFRVDPKYFGGKLPAEINGKGKGSGWSGRRLGLKKYALPGRIWHGLPAPLKARVGGLGAAAGGMMYAAPRGEE